MEKIMWKDADSGGGIDTARETSDSTYHGVLTIHADGTWGIPVGTAVLIAPRFALTVAHLFLKEHAGLKVAGLLSKREAGIKKIHFMKNGSVDIGSSQPIHLPKVIGMSEDDFALLELDTAMPGSIPFKSDLDDAYTGDLIAAAETRYTNKLIMGTATVTRNGSDGIFGRVDRQPGGGLCESSGAPLFFDDPGNPAFDLAVVGCHCYRTPAVPNSSPEQGFYLKLDAAAAAWIRQVVAEDSSSMKGLERSLPEASHAPEYFHLVKTSDPAKSTYAGPLCFVKLGDLSEIHGVKWKIVYGAGSIGLLRLGTEVWTTKIDSDHASIVIKPVGGAPQTLIATVSGVGARHWLVGTLHYGGFTLLVYLFRVKDDVLNPLKPRRIHIELFDIAGSEIGQLPDLQTPVPGCPIEDVGSGPGDALRAVKGRIWDQDEIGNGHED
jgi:hypothetical protein